LKTRKRERRRREKEHPVVSEIQGVGHKSDILTKYIEH